MSNPELQVRPHPPVEVRNENYPWINTPVKEVSSVAVKIDEITFLYGSIVGLNKSIQKISSQISPNESISLQRALFNSLPYLLSGKPHQGISKVENSNSENGVLLAASRNLTQEPFLLFAIEHEKKPTELPLVLRVGTGSAKNLPKTLGIMGIKQPGGQRRRN